MQDDVFYCTKRTRLFYLHECSKCQYQDCEKHPVILRFNPQEDETKKESKI